MSDFPELDPTGFRDRLDNVVPVDNGTLTVGDIMRIVQTGPLRVEKVPIGTAGQALVTDGATWAPGDVVTNAGGVPSYQADTRANQPAAGTVGRFYYVTDEDVLEYDDGAAWVLVFSGTYRKDDRPAVLGAGDMAVEEGAPNITGVGSRWVAYAYDDGGSVFKEVTAGIVDIPASWSTVDVVVWHSTTSGNAGNAVLRSRIYTPSPGQTLATEDSVVSATVAAVGSSNELGEATILSGLAVTGGRTLVAIARIGGDASDDLTGDFLILHVELRKAS